MDDMKNLHVGSGNNLQVYTELEKEKIKVDIQAEQSMMLGYLQSQGIELHDYQNKSSADEISKINVVYNNDYNLVDKHDDEESSLLYSLAVDYDLDFYSLYPIYTVLNPSNDEILNGETLDEIILKLNNVVSSEEEVPDKPKLINKGKSYHDSKKNLRFLNKHK